MPCTWLGVSIRFCYQDGKWQTHVLLVVRADPGDLEALLRLELDDAHVEELVVEQVQRGGHVARLDELRDGEVVLPPDDLLRRAILPVRLGEAQLERLVLEELADLGRHLHEWHERAVE